MGGHILHVDETISDCRVDIFVARELPEEIPSRMFAKRLIEAGRVHVNGQDVKGQYKVRPGDEVRVDIRLEDYPDDRVKPENVPLDIVYEDGDLIAVNKPSGMSVHPAAGHYGGTLVNALVHYCFTLSDVNGAKRPGIVHRLDRETSGVILVAKTNQAHARLARQFEKHTVQKEYVALVEGRVQFDEGVINAWIGRHKRFHDMRRVVPDGEGKTARTVYRVLKRHKDRTAVALFPETGRTHQLRLHMRHIGHPVLGDDKYGHRENFSRLALHARRVSFTHPCTKDPLEISVSLPDEFLAYV